MTPQSRQCERCHRIVESRGPTEARFCPVCGERLPASATPAAREVAEITPARRTSVQALVGLIVGVISLVIQPCAFPLGLISVLLGFSAQRSIERAAGLLGGRGFAIGAVVLGLISTGIWLLINLLLRPGHEEYARF